MATSSSWRYERREARQHVKEERDMLRVNRRISLALFVVTASATVVLFAQGFNARTGTWEFTMTVQGAIPMEGIPANMRAQLEAEMRKPQVYHSCVTADDLKSLKLGKKDDG